MTPEERAKAFVEEHRGFDLDGNCWFIACDRAEANLAQALRQAENDKLEEAAALLVSDIDGSGHDPYEACLLRSAAMIRALKKD